MNAGPPPASPEPSGRSEVAEASNRGGGAVRVAAGIFASRVVGFLRDRAIAHYFGVGPHADVFRTALRGPNILQNLLGEGTISASFVPIYSRLLAEGRREDAGRFAGAIFGLLLATAAVLSIAGILLARPIVALFAAGYLGDAVAVAAGQATVDRFELAVTAVRIVFPMTGVLVLAAWALGVLNSHRRFFVPYVAPVAWNAAIIAALLWTASALTGDPTGLGARDRLLVAACLGALAGGVLQLGVQLPVVVRVMRGFRLSFSTRVEGVRQALVSFLPVLAGRGVVQISAYLDLLLASLVAPGAVAALGWAQTLYVLPVSLFGLSVAAAELPEMSSAKAAEAAAEVAGRVDGSLRQMAFVNVPTAVGYILFGFLLVGGIYRTGSFSLTDTWLVYLVLAGYSLGLVAATSARLLQSAFYALGDTRTPSIIAVQRVALAALVGFPLMLWLDRYLVTDLLGAVGVVSPLRLGACGLALGSGVAAWFELVRLWTRAGRRLPALARPWSAILRFAALAGGSGAVAAALWWLLPPLHPALAAALVVGAYAILYLAAAHLLHLPEAEPWIGRLLRTIGRVGRR